MTRSIWVAVAVSIFFGHGVSWAGFEPFYIQGNADQIVANVPIDGVLVLPTRGATPDLAFVVDPQVRDEGGDLVAGDWEAYANKLIFRSTEPFVSGQQLTASMWTYWASPPYLERTFVVGSQSLTGSRTVTDEGAEFREREAVEQNEQTCCNWYPAEEGDDGTPGYRNCWTTKRHYVVNAYIYFDLDVPVSWTRYYSIVAEWENRDHRTLLSVDSNTLFQGELPYWETNVPRCYVARVMNLIDGSSQERRVCAGDEIEPATRRGEEEPNFRVCEGDAVNLATGEIIDLTSGDPSDGPDPRDRGSSDGGCSTGTSGAGGLFGPLLVLMMVARRRRRD